MSDVIVSESAVKSALASDHQGINGQDVALVSWTTEDVCSKFDGFTSSLANVRVKYRVGEQDTREVCYVIKESRDTMSCLKNEMTSYCQKEEKQPPRHCMDLYRGSRLRYTGNAGDALRMIHNSKPFTAYDYLVHNYDCAFEMEGGWWYGDKYHCAACNLNGRPLRGTESETLV